MQVDYAYEEKFGDLDFGSIHKSKPNKGEGLKPKPIIWNGKNYESISQIGKEAGFNSTQMQMFRNYASKYHSIDRALAYVYGENPSDEKYDIDKALDRYDSYVNNKKCKLSDYEKEMLLGYVEYYQNFSEALEALNEDISVKINKEIDKTVKIVSKAEKEQKRRIREAQKKYKEEQEEYERQQELAEQRKQVARDDAKKKRQEIKELNQQIVDRIMPKVTWDTYKDAVELYIKLSDGKIPNSLKETTIKKIKQACEENQRKNGKGGYIKPYGGYKVEPFQKDSDELTPELRKILTDTIYYLELTDNARSFFNSGKISFERPIAHKSYSVLQLVKKLNTKEYSAYIRGLNNKLKNGEPVTAALGLGQIKNQLHKFKAVNIPLSYSYIDIGCIILYCLCADVQGIKYTTKC